MNTAIALSQLIIALGIYNVWLVRPKKATAWRGGAAQTMVEEFQAYGFSGRFMAVVGAVKLTAATLLIVGFWYPPCAVFAATIMALLMLAAILMHMKVKDPLHKSLPAATLFVLSVLVAVSH